MIQTVLFITVVALVVAHLLRPKVGERVEGFTNRELPTYQSHMGGPNADVVSLDGVTRLVPTITDRGDDAGPRIDPFKADTPGPATDHPSMSPDVEDDPRDLPWIASWSAADRYARRGKDCVPTHLEDGPDGTVIITTSKSCEDGLPHTREGDRIIIPDSLPLAMREETIRHEMVHIHQRRQPKEWLLFYRRNWSFEFHPSAPQGMPKALIDARRGNPDTWDFASGGPWPCWMNRWWPVPIYRSPQNPRLRDAVTVWWDAWKRETLEVAPCAWSAFFGNPAQNEHPHELSATMIVAEDTMSEAGRRLMNWWGSAAVLSVQNRKGQ